jgi:hypothetical protein
MRTPEFIRETAERHYATLIGFAEQRESCIEDARAHRDLGLRIIDAALALPAGELLQLHLLMPEGLSKEEAFQKAMKVLPFMMGTLQLLDMEWWHETLGTVPHAVVCRLFKDEPSVMHEGLELTARNVFLRFRRLPTAA